MEPYLYLDGNKAVATAHGAGPWDPSMLHGGVPGALVAQIVDALPSAVPMRTVRLTIDLQRPVPIGPLDIETRVTREGRNIITAEIILSANGKDVVRATALKIRADTSYEQPDPKPPPLDVMPPEKAKPLANDIESASFNKTVEWRLAHPPAEHGGPPMAAWFNITRPFFDSVPTTALMRATAAGDYCNGMGSGLDFKKWTFINADLCLHFAREPVGEWILLAPKAWVGPDGRAVAFGELADINGYFGRATQCLVIAQR